MTPDDVRAAAEQLVEFHERFAPLFGKEQAQDHAYDYVKGLMVCPERKSIEPIALLVGHGDVSGLQKFVNAAPWQYDDVQAEVQAVFADELVPSAAGSPGRRRRGRSTSRPSPRRGRTPPAWPGSTTAGSARRTTARSASSWSASPPAGSALLDHRLYLPEAWCEDTPRRARPPRQGPHPRGVGLPHQAADRRRAGPRRRGARARRTWTGWSPTRSTAGPAHFLDELETLEQRYVVEVPVDDDGLDRATRPACVPAYSGRGRAPTQPTPRRGAHAWPRWPPGCPPAAWQALQVREGAVRPAGLRVRGGAGLGDAAPQAGPAGLAADPPVAGGDARGQVLRLQRRRRDAAGDAGAGGLHAAPGRGVLRGLQELPGDGAVRDAVVGRLAPPHDAGGAGAPVRDADAAAISKKSRRS